MTAGLFVALAAAGGLGAAIRFVLDGAIRDRVGAAYPVGITVINLSGAFLLGLLTGWVSSAVLPDELRAILSTGLLGGYTTFSTASIDTVRLLRDGRIGPGLLNGLGMLIAGVALAAAGYALGS